MPLIDSSHPHEFNALTGPTAPPRGYIIFYSNVVDGRMWCPDCRDVESIVKDAFDGEDKPKCVISWVGNLKEWKDPRHPSRHEWNLKGIPTIIRFDKVGLNGRGLTFKGEETGRLDETGILDPVKWKAFLEE